jgi:UDP-2-acetamido-3-amino-2,3-dideoxy-glucuronate N-acetyltransferase
MTQPYGKKPSVGVIGTGYWGPNLARNFHELGALTAICDKNPEALEKLRSLYPQVRTYDDADELAADSEVSAVAIATSAATHGVMTQKFLEAGKHVFVEKPLCLDPDEAVILGEMADEMEQTLMVGHLLLYHLAFRAVQAAVADGKVGTMQYIYSNRASFGKIRAEENALWSFAPHDVSMILALIGQLPQEVLGVAANYVTDGVSDVTISHLFFEHGVQAHIFVSWLHPYKDHRLVVAGDQGMIVFNDSAAGADKLIFYPHTAKWEGDVPIATKAQGVPLEFAESEPLRVECQHFLDCLVKGTRPTSDWQEAERVLRVLRACEESIQSGARVTL